MKLIWLFWVAITHLNKTFVCLINEFIEIKNE